MTEFLIGLSLGLISGWMLRISYVNTINEHRSKKESERKAAENYQKLQEQRKALDEQLKKSKPSKKSYNPTLESGVKFW